jgi:hypothetical protein
MKPMKTNLTFYFVSVAVALLGACADESGELTGRGNITPGDGQTDPGATPGGTDPGDPVLCTSRTYAGFDSTQLHADRLVARVGIDRSRIKPFSALSDEYTRVLGAAPATLAGSGPTFGQVPKNWYEEPQSNAVALQTAYSIAFDGCITYTAKPEFDATPDATNAPVQCSAMARKFWSKTPSPQEIQACVDVATTGAAAEPQPRRKWAYACASVLTSAGFLTY